MPSSDHFLVEDVAPGVQKFTPNNVWGSNSPTGAEEELTLTSGQTCRARKMTVERVIQTGLLSEVDSLTALVDKNTRKIKGGKGVPDGTPVVTEDIIKDTESLALIIGVVDKLIPHIVISPTVVAHYRQVKVGNTTVTQKLSDDDREEIRAEHGGRPVVFTDQIGLEDKMELFNWALGGIEAFSTFRRDTDGDVGSVVPGDRPSGKTKRPRRNR